ncbi:tolloid-like protein 2 isoform X2 [Halichondria panicea]
MCGGLTLTLLSLAVGLLLCGQRTLCQLLPDLSDPCASSATQVHDNDIAYFPPSLLPQNESPSNSGSEDRKKRGATIENRKLWPNGVVYYTFSSRFNAAERRQILEAMKHWEDHTCIRFKQRSNQPHYVNFFPGAGYRRVCVYTLLSQLSQSSRLLRVSMPSGLLLVCRWTQLF